MEEIVLDKKKLKMYILPLEVVHGKVQQHTDHDGKACHGTQVHDGTRAHMASHGGTRGMAPYKISNF